MDDLLAAELGSKIKLKLADGSFRSMTKCAATAKRVVDGALRGNVRQLEFLIRHSQTRG